jgi:hypothetical protein
MILGVFAVNPRHATVHLLSIGINAVTGNTGNSAPVPILRQRFYLSLLPETQFRERLFRLRTKWLPSFGGVDLCESDLYLLLIFIQDGQRVTVTDADQLSRGRERLTLTRPHFFNALQRASQAVDHDSFIRPAHVIVGKPFPPGPSVAQSAPATRLPRLLH